MNALGQASAPSEWTGELVRSRLIEAFEIERRLPREHRQWLASAWPAYSHDFADMVYWTDGRARVWDDWARAKGVFSWEMSRMEEALGWLHNWLSGDERQYLGAWTHSEVYGWSITRMTARRGVSRSTFYRTLDRAAERIAARLNAEGVMIR
jgi:DNA-directed RNA polymerase specialized sigma24 family protein